MEIRLSVVLLGVLLLLGSALSASEPSALFSPDDLEAQALGDLEDALALDRTNLEIGRASCRERVCQYV